MPMASDDTLPDILDFLSLCERCRTPQRELWLHEGEYLCTSCIMEHKKVRHTKKYQEVTVTISGNSVNKNIYGWTKWYGANNNLYALSLEWFCQACQDKQTDGLPSYLIRIIDQDFARICSKCLRVALDHKIHKLLDLLPLVRKDHPDF